jgi:hypothetical protein
MNGQIDAVRARLNGRIAKIFKLFERENCFPLKKRIFFKRALTFSHMTHISKPVNNAQKLKKKKLLKNVWLLRGAGHCQS